jgi:poly(A) polymerase
MAAEAMTSLSMQERFAALLGRPAVADLMALMNGEGAETRIIGGAVRNTLLNLPTTDIDLATTLRPDQAMARASSAGHKVVPTGIAHGTVTVVIGKVPFEITTLRRDVATDGRHATIAFADSFEEDALRRDFTINQFSLSADGVVHDYAGGLADLQARRVRFIGDPDTRIAEDYLRIMRFFRFHAAYGEGPLDAPGLAACIRLRAGMARLSAERIRAELMKLLVARGAHSAVPEFVAGGIWSEITGGLAADVPAFEACLSGFPGSDAVTRLAALGVRDITDCQKLDAALRLSADERKRCEAVAVLLAEWADPARLTETQVRLSGLRHGARAVQDTLSVLALRLGSARSTELAALPIPVSPFRGADLLALGVPAGPAVGAALSEAIRRWADLGFPDDPATQAAILRDVTVT